eukprot:NODE_3519_length_1335_cov_61.691419_g3075_i0.p1 GENE.NODE_3519_length_1335_cov_61.691419_g3075_i0~~NODE_3519_length_1335_cov_61.691419_g3075_i0.p1  ORF type:complete len:355 (-),score=56.53 NODE_3519_length_1335_cov_61.691419_g3075_i0:269-1174(-)
MSLGVFGRNRTLLLNPDTSSNTDTNSDKNTAYPDDRGMHQFFGYLVAIVVCRAGTAMLLTYSPYLIRYMIQPPYLIWGNFTVSDVDSALSIISTAWLLTASFAALLGGWLADHLGRFQVCAISLALKMVWPITMVITSSYQYNLIAAIIFGIGSGAFSSASWAMGIDLVFNMQDSGRNIAMMESATALAYAIGPAVVSPFMHVLYRHEASIRTIYLMVLGICCVFYILGLVVLKTLKYKYIDEPAEERSLLLYKVAPTGMASASSFRLVMQHQSFYRAGSYDIYRSSSLTEYRTERCRSLP